MIEYINSLISRNRMVFILLGLSVALCYAWILPAPFKTVDDYISIINNPQIKSVSRLPEILTGSFFNSGSYYRPLVLISFMIEYGLFGLKPMIFNFTNILLHLLNAFLVFLIVDKSSRDRWLAFVASLLFAVHPLQWEAVTNIPGRSILLCALFFFLSFYLFILYAGKEKNSYLYTAGIAACYILSLMSKESAVLLPFVMAAWVIINLKECQPVLSRMMTSVSVCLAVTAAYIGLRKCLGITNMNHWAGYEEMFLGVSTFLKSSIVHLIMVVMPVNLYFDRSEELIGSISDLWVAASWVFWLVIFACIAFGFKYRNKSMDFFSVWAVLNMAIVAQFVPIVVAPGYISTADHFLYISSAGVFVALIIFVRIIFAKLRRGKMAGLRVIRIAAVGYFVFLFSMTVKQTIYSTNQITMYKETLKNNPQNSRVRNALATAYAHAKMYSEAEDQYALVLKVEPWNIDAKIGYAVSLCDQGHCAQALREYDSIRGEIKEPRLLEHNINVAVARLAHQYEQRIKTDGASAGLHHSLGVVYSRQGRVDEAIAQYELALNLDPKHPHTLFNLANLKDAIGRRKYALDLYKRYVSSPGADKELSAQAQARIDAISQSSENIN